MLSREQVLEKVAKLLRLAQSSNAHEAANAAARAQEIMDRYRLDAASIQLDDDSSAISMLEVSRIGKTQVTRWKWALASIVSGANNCAPWQHRDPGGVMLVFYGKQADANAALYLYMYLVREVERLANLANKGYGRSWLNSFRWGALKTIKERLDASRVETRRQALESGVSETSLAVLDRGSEDAIAYLEEQGKTYRKGAAIRLNDADGFSRGVQAGKTIALGGSKALPSE